MCGAAEGEPTEPFAGGVVGDLSFDKQQQPPKGISLFFFALFNFPFINENKNKKFNISLFKKKNFPDCEGKLAYMR